MEALAQQFLEHRNVLLRCRLAKGGAAEWFPMHVFGYIPLTGRLDDYARDGQKLFLHHTHCF